MSRQIFHELTEGEGKEKEKGKTENSTTYVLNLRLILGVRH